VKRSEINSLLRQGRAFFEQMNVALPPWADWGPARWRAAGPEYADIPTYQLGWDITNFGSDDYYRVGLFLFTLRNGPPAARDGGLGKPYAEKVMIVRENQVTPTHFHRHKMEDIINRGGGNLVVQLWPSTADAALGSEPVTVDTDGVKRQVAAGDTLVLRPGESITLPRFLYHQFWAEEGAGWTVLGEVSTVNDDRTDNHFHDGAGRFPAIEEDEAPLHLLVSDYPDYYAHA